MGALLRVVRLHLAPPLRPAAIAIVVAVNGRVLAIEHLLVVHAEAAVHQGAAVRAAAATRAMTTPAIPPHQNALRTPQVNRIPAISLHAPG